MTLDLLLEPQARISRSPKREPIYTPGEPGMIFVPKGTLVALLSLQELEYVITVNPISEYRVLRPNPEGTGFIPGGESDLPKGFRIGVIEKIEEIFEEASDCGDVEVAREVVMNYQMKYSVPDRDVYSWKFLMD